METNKKTTKVPSAKRRGSSAQRKESPNAAVKVPSIDKIFDQLTSTFKSPKKRSLSSSGTLDGDREKNNLEQLTTIFSNEKKKKRGSGNRSEGAFGRAKNKLDSLLPLPSLFSEKTKRKRSQSSKGARSSHGGRSLSRSGSGHVGSSRKELGKRGAEGSRRNGDGTKRSSRAKRSNDSSDDYSGFSSEEESYLSDDSQDMSLFPTARRRRIFKGRRRSFMGRDLDLDEGIGLGELILGKLGIRKRRRDYGSDSLDDYDYDEYLYDYDYSELDDYDSDSSYYAGRSGNNRRHGRSRSRSKSRRNKHNNSSQRTGSPRPGSSRNGSSRLGSPSGDKTTRSQRGKTSTQSDSKDKSSSELHVSFDFSDIPVRVPPVVRKKRPRAPSPSRRRGR